MFGQARAFPLAGGGRAPPPSFTLRGTKLVRDQLDRGNPASLRMLVAFLTDMVFFSP